jgi:hypothetical protein
LKILKALGDYAPATGYPHCDDDVLPATNLALSHCTPTPTMRPIDAKGDIILTKKKVSAEQFLLPGNTSIFTDFSILSCPG